LKAWLVEQGIVVPKIHDLEALTKSCLPTLPELSNHIEDAIHLTSFAVEIRYPGMFATISDAQTCWNAARTIRKAIRNSLNL
jgi:HEPN domain-containing protein